MPIKNPNTSVNLASRYTTDIGDEGGIVSLESGKKNEPKMTQIGRIQEFQPV